jgi:pSer/pThr/pTyr-binding forkhead associated (FHA) protein
VSDPEEESSPEQDTAKTAVYRPLPRPEAPEDAGKDHRIEVEVIGGPMDGVRQAVSGPSFTIGRGESNDLQLVHDETISTRHAQIIREGDHYWLVDLDSRNGTFLGDEQIQGRALIGPGTLFTVGLTTLEFLPHS